MGSFELTAANGRRRRKRLSGETKKDVADKIRQARAEGAPGSALKLGTFLDDWLASRDVTGLRQSTRQSYRDTLKLHVRPFLEDTPLRALTPSVLDDWLEQMHRTKKTKATIRYAKIVLRISLQRAIRRGLLSSNPVSVLRVKGGTRRAPTALSSAEVKALLENASPWMRVAILLASLVGLRRGEICGLRWDDLDWKTGELEIERSISAISGQSEPKTPASHRLVQLPGLVVGALEGHRRRMEIVAAGTRRQPSAWMFPADNGKAKHPRNFLHSYESAREGAGLATVRFHDLRHTCATALLTLGNDLKSVSELLGHADVRTTLAMYHHPDSALQRKGAASLQRWLTAAGVSSEEGGPIEGQ
jgi:integrase